MHARAAQTSGGKARKMIFVEFWGRDALPLPRPAFTARSLVGMSMGSRKRMFERECWRQLDENPYFAGVPSGASEEDTAKRYRQWVARGIRSMLLHTPHARERLRPCPHCEMWRRAGFKQESGRCPTCDQNSGLLPARKARKARR